jgi:hypothetical protein
MAFLDPVCVDVSAPSAGAIDLPARPALPSHHGAPARLALIVADLGGCPRAADLAHIRASGPGGGESMFN